MSRTTIEITEKRKEELREARLPHESNYSETIGRLLQSDDMAFVTEKEAHEIARQEAEEVIASYKR
jgi:hypothetical protein